MIDSPLANPGKPPTGGEKKPSETRRLAACNCYCGAVPHLLQPPSLPTARPCLPVALLQLSQHAGAQARGSAPRKRVPRVGSTSSVTSCADAVLRGTSLRLDREAPLKLIGHRLGRDTHAIFGASCHLRAQRYRDHVLERAMALAREGGLDASQNLFTITRPAAVSIIIFLHTSHSASTRRQKQPSFELNPQGYTICLQI